MTVKALETTYNGYRFRSRLEARWAIFFDALGIRWEYEKEGFDLGACGCYLPDFYLPAGPLWVEIKGLAPTETEYEKCASLRDLTGTAVYIVNGPPLDEWGTLYCWSKCDVLSALSPADRPSDVPPWESSEGPDDINAKIGGLPLGRIWFTVAGCPYRYCTNRDFYASETMDVKLSIYRGTLKHISGSEKTAIDAARAARFEGYR